MPDTSSAAYHRETEPTVRTVEPVDGTWFETGDEPPADGPLVLLVPVTDRRGS
jgi:hypothetical protein